MYSVLGKGSVCSHLQVGFRSNPAYNKTGINGLIAWLNTRQIPVMQWRRQHRSIYMDLSQWVEIEGRLIATKSYERLHNSEMGASYLYLRNSNMSHGTTWWPNCHPTQTGTITHQSPHRTGLRHHHWCSNPGRSLDGPSSPVRVADHSSAEWRNSLSCLLSEAVCIPDIHICIPEIRLQRSHL